MSARAASQQLVGILLVVLATLAFAATDAITKHLAMLYPVPVIMAVRYVVNFALLVLLLWPRQGVRLVETNRFLLHLARGLCLVAASLLVGWALRVMPVGETSAITYLAPLLVMMLAMPVLGERVTVVGWAAAIFGFVGVMLIIRPGGDLDPLGVLLALCNAGLSTAFHLITRLLGRTESTSSMIFHTAWVGALASCALAIPDFGGFTAPPADLGLMVVLGAVATLGHFLFTAAYRQAPASILAPVSYAQLVWAGLLGWLVFSHIPNLVTLIGMVLVLGAGIAAAAGGTRKR